MPLAPLLADSGKSLPPRDAHVDRVLFGFLQPFRAVGRIINDRELLREATYPALLLAVVCGGIAVLTTFPGLATLRRFYQVFVFLAPLPSLLLAPSYARFAVMARVHAGGGPCRPLIEPFGLSLRRTFGQMILIAVALAPLTLLLRWLPFIGVVLVKAVAGLWALHWIVVNAFESARVLEPDQTLADVEALAARAPSPWFVRGLRAIGERVPALGGAARWFASFCDRLARPWSEEIHLCEQHPSLMIGFAITTALLLCTPVLNLFFRPVVLVAASDVQARL